MDVGRLCRRGERTGCKEEGDEKRKRAVGTGSVGGTLLAQVKCLVQKCPFSKGDLSKLIAVHVNFKQTERHGQGIRTGVLGFVVSPRCWKPRAHPVRTAEAGGCNRATRAVRPNHAVEGSREDYPTFEETSREDRSVNAAICKAPTMPAGLLYSQPLLWRQPLRIVLHHCASAFHGNSSA